ncbi:MAG: P-loop NTPase fold protein [Methylophilaceae bacterium]
MDKKNDTPDYEFEILYESASDQDLFPDKTHERVSNSIHNLITKSKSGLTIGLEGSWGSGKTTVINLLHKKIKSTKQKTLFFLFDTWAHEGDPLRRVFLESLINKIDPNNSSIKLQKILKEVSGHQKKVEVKSKNKTSKFANYLTISAMFIPMGAALLTSVDYSKLYLPFNALASTLPNFLFWSGFILSMSPALVMLYWFFYGEKDDEGKRDWSLILSNSTESYTQTITEDNERSSIEFGRYFQSIMEVGLSKDHNNFKDAVIVIDNLDRVDPDHADRLWSTLQTFFQHRNTDRLEVDSWIKSLWFIVPYDRDAMSHSWDKGSKTNSSERSNSFFNKCFQLIVQVPAPVMSGWNDYVTKGVNNALIGWNESDKSDVIRTYIRHSSNLNISPTPRKINNFINQVGFKGMQWGSEMSAESISLYSILSNKYTEGKLREMLQVEGLPDNFEPYGEPYTIKKELAGLLFGVKKAKGIELLLTPIIIKAVNEGDGEQIKGLINTHGQAFWITWHEIKQSIFETFSNNEKARLSGTQAIAKGMQQHSSHIKHDIIKLERIWQNSNHAWSINSLNYAEVLEDLYNITRNKDKFVSWVQLALSNRIDDILKNIEASETDRPYYIELVIQLNKISNFLIKYGKQLNPRTYSKFNVDKWVYWLGLLEDQKLSLPFILPAKGVIEQLGNKHLSSSLSIPADNLIALLETYKIDLKSLEWSSVIQHLITWANRPNRESGNELAYKLMLTLYSDFHIEGSTKLIEDCIKAPQFWRVGNRENSDNSPSLFILTGCVLGSSIQSIGHLDQKIKGYWSKNDNSMEKINFVFERLKAVKQLSKLWEISKDKNNHLAINILKEKINEPELQPNDEALRSIDSYVNWDGNNDCIATIVHKISESSGFESVMQMIEESPLDHDKTIYNIQLFGDDQAVNGVNKLLRSLNKEVWDMSFQKDNDLLLCVFHSQLKLGHEYKKSFLEFYSSSVKGNEISDWLWEDFNTLLDKAIDKNRVLKKLTDDYFSTETDILSDIGFTHLIKNISPYVIKVDPIKLMERICFWLEKSMWDRIEWFTNINIRIKLNGDPLEELKSRITSKNYDDEKYDLINRLGKIFKIKIPKNKIN